MAIQFAHNTQAQLDTRNLNVYINGAQILKDVNVSIPKNKITCIIGKEVTWFYGKASGKAEALLLTAAQLGSRSLQSVFHFLPETYCLEIMLYDAVQFLLVADTMDAATISHIVVDAHRERAWTLRNKTDVAAHFREFAAAGLKNVVVSEIHLSIHLQTFHAVVQSVKGSEKRRLAAA